MSNERYPRGTGPSDWEADARVRQVGKPALTPAEIEAQAEAHLAAYRATPAGANILKAYRNAVPYDPEANSTEDLPTRICKSDMIAWLQSRRKLTTVDQAMVDAIILQLKAH